MKKVLTISGWTLSILLLLAAGGLLIVATPLFGNKALIVRSGSMEPAFSVGDLVVVRPQTESYKPNDIISFKAGPNNETIITHRVLEVSDSENPRTYTTKGDANAESDNFLVEEKNILGRSLFVVPYIGKLLAFAKTKLGFSLLVMIPTLFVIIAEGKVIYREVRRKSSREKILSAQPVQNLNSFITPSQQFAAQPTEPVSHVSKPLKKPVVHHTAWRPSMGTLTVSSIRTTVDGVAHRAAILFIVCCAAVGTWAAYSDTAQSTGNVFAASLVFSPTPTPTVSPEPTPSVTPTPTPSPTIEPTPTPTPSVTPTPTPTVSPNPSPSPTPGPGDVVINEVMWMGSTISFQDEWLELRNMTSNPIDVTDWSIENAGAGGSLITLTGTIPANGFFLISKSLSDNPQSALNDSTVVVDKSSNLSFNNDGEQLTLLNNVAVIIDQTPFPPPAWAAGTSITLRQSMERDSIPGLGTVVSNWHTCTNVACTDIAYWDAVGNNYGTPKSANSPD